VRPVGRKSRCAEGVAFCHGGFAPDLSRGVGRELAAMRPNINAGFSTIIDKFVINAHRASRLKTGAFVSNQE
jgi:hypothetical protein